MGSSQFRSIIGCMSGTSLDGVDAVIGKIEGAGLNIQAKYIGAAHASMPPAIRSILGRLASGEPASPIEYLRAGRELGLLYANVINDLCRHHEDESIAFVVAHGQTIWHAPQEGLSWQLLDAALVTRQVGLPVLCDLRQSDLASGGEGAPITPLSDWVLYRDARRSRLVVNLGGISNVTMLNAGSDLRSIRGGDTGVCNLLIDGVVTTLYPDLTHDQDGRLAADGRPHEIVSQLVHEHPFYHQPGPRSAGREGFSSDWLKQIIRRVTKDMSPQDMIASAVDTVAQDVALYAHRMRPQDIILAGGGAMNPVLVARIRASCPSDCTLILSDELGIPATAREALGLSVLGALCQDEVPITLSQITGAQNPGRSGCWTFP